MNRLSLLPLVLLLACNGSLSDEQRKKVREEMENSKIVRVTEGEIMTAALQKGQQVMKAIGDRPFSAAMIDSLEQAHNVNINWSVPGGSNALAIEQELINAYIAGIAEGAAQENLQKIYRSNSTREFDTLLYSRPKVTKLADGAEQLDGIWNVYVAKSDVVKAISRSK